MTGRWAGALAALIALAVAVAVLPAGAGQALEGSTDASSDGSPTGGTSTTGPTDATGVTGRLPCAGAAPFSDVETSSPFCAEIEWLAARTIGGGFPDGGFRPGNDITRQALAAFLYRLAGEPTFTPPASPTFNDVGASHPFRTEIEWLAARQIGGGFPDGGFRPANPITRQAVAAFLYRYDGELPLDPVPGTPTFTDVDAGHPFRTEIQWLTSQRIGGGFPDGTFRPGDDITRQAVAAFLYRFTDMAVVVGDSGTMLTSRNGVWWQTRFSGTTNHLLGVAADDLGIWSAVGAAGTILRSTDGVNWSPRPTVTAQILRDVAHDGNGTMVAVGDLGVLVRSTDSLTWTQQSSTTSSGLRSVTHYDGNWLAVGQGGTAIRSLNSTSWATRTTGTTSELIAVAATSGRFLSVGPDGLARSARTFTNLNVWTGHSTGTSNWLRGVAADDDAGRWVVVGDGGIGRTATDLGAWVTATMGVPTPLYAVDHGARRWDGERQFIAVGALGVIRHSTNGGAWGGGSMLTSSHLRGVGSLDR